MADDTRQSPREDLSRSALNVSPENKPFTGTQWQDGNAAPYTPPANANMMPGGTAHTAGGEKVAEGVTLGSAFESIKLEEFMSIHKKPCVRDSFMTGIGSGAGIGGLRFLFGAATWSACNWAVGSWALGSFIMYQYCNHQRQREKEGMMRAVEILNKKDNEKRAREARREARRKAKDEEQDRQLAALKDAQALKQEGGKSWWKPW